MNRITITDLSKSFGKKIVFSNLNATFDEGITCIGGSSGCGKTTLMRIIAGLDKQYSGNICGVTGNVTYMFQEPRLIPSLSASENVCIVCSNKSDSRKKADDLLFSLGFTEDDISKTPMQLSGGMQQRVSLARAVLFVGEHGGNTVILDEPFKGLDPKSAELAASMISTLKDKIILIVTHNETDTQIVNGKKVMFEDFL